MPCLIFLDPGDNLIKRFAGNKINTDFHSCVVENVSVRVGPTWIYIFLLNVYVVICTVFIQNLPFCSNFHNFSISDSNGLCLLLIFSHGMHRGVVNNEIDMLSLHAGKQDGKRCNNKDRELLFHGISFLKNNALFQRSDSLGIY